MTSDTLCAIPSLPEFNISSSDTSEFNASTTVPELVSIQAERFPAAAAVVAAGGALSYAELIERANAVAASLRSAGLTSNEPVAIYLESSTELIVAALGVWKAGGAYLPIDPAYPVDRAAFILSDSGAPILLTRRDLASTLEDGPWVKIALEEIPPVPAGEMFSASAVKADDLAYIIYTSGSTGQPKGVEITHRNLMNLVEWHNLEFDVTRDDRATQVAGPGFDAAVWELWPSLAAGAAIHLPSREARLSSTLLKEWIVAQQITISFAPTVLAEEMLGLKWPAETSLRCLLTGGDALHRFPPADLPFRLVNNYGPTECTVVATSATVYRPESEHIPPAIGTGILNTPIFLLDEDGREVAPGEAGEIYIGGPSVGRGYRNRPEQTRASFVSVTIAGKAERTFRTGDLAKRLPDGQFAFVGRADDQIKIRGFRIEPDEIASVINRHPSIVSSAVIARNDNKEVRGDKRLVAYVVATPGAEVWDRDLRDLLTRTLPDYMVPANFVLLEHIPVTANGKLDKAALPAPTDKNQLRKDNYAAPRNELEEIVEGILSPILGLDRVSIHDNFFLLGGHSLMGAQVIAKVRDIFDVELNLRNVFESPTVAKLAGKIEASLTATLEAMSEDDVHRALRAQGASDLSPNGIAHKEQ